MSLEQIRNIAAGIFILNLIFFFFTTIGMIINVMFGGSFEEFFHIGKENSQLWMYKTMFWLIIISAGIFKFTGGEFSKLRLFGGGFPYED